MSLYAFAKLSRGSLEGKAGSCFALIVCVVCIGAITGCVEDTTHACMDSSNTAWVQATNGAAAQPVAWPGDACLSLIHTPLESLGVALHHAADAWTQHACADLCIRVSLDGGAAVDSADGLNSVTIETDPIAWGDRFGNDALSATLVTSDLATGEILDADIVLNGTRYAFVDGETEDCPDASTADLQNVLTHELGHLLGFAHSSNPESAMFLSWGEPVDGVCETSKRVLADVDVAGVCALYGVCGAAPSND